MRIFDPFGKAVDDAWGLHMDQTNGLHMPLELPKTTSQKFSLHLGCYPGYGSGLSLKVFTAQLAMQITKCRERG